MFGLRSAPPAHVTMWMVVEYTDAGGSSLLLACVGAVQNLEMALHIEPEVSDDVDDAHKPRGNWFHAAPDSGWSTPGAGTGVDLSSPRTSEGEAQRHA